jgi:hypothetical protein
MFHSKEISEIFTASIRLLMTSISGVDEIRAMCVVSVLRSLQLFPGQKKGGSDMRIEKRKASMARATAPN